MKNNIFEGAYFGKTYNTRNGRIVRYCGKQASMYVLEDDGVAVDYFPDGTFQTSGESEFDIVSEGQEEIDKEELDRLAVEYADHAEMTGTSQDGYNTGCWDYLDIVKAFKAGRLS